MTLKKIEAILLGDDEEFKKAVILKLASSILPRINEHSGEGGGAIQVVIAPELATKYEIAPGTSGNSTGSA